jgi:hypothetical protein
MLQSIYIYLTIFRVFGPPPSRIGQTCFLVSSILIPPPPAVAAEHLPNTRAQARRHLLARCALNGKPFSLYEQRGNLRLADNELKFPAQIKAVYPKHLEQRFLRFASQFDALPSLRAGEAAERLARTTEAEARATLQRRVDQLVPSPPTSLTPPPQTDVLKAARLEALRHRDERRAAEAAFESTRAAERAARGAERKELLAVSPPPFSLPCFI